MTSSVHIALQGLRDAIELLAPTSNTIEAAAAVGSASFWACALDDQLAASDEQYKVRRDADPNGSLMPGIRLVRNAVTHGAVVTVEQAPGLRFPVRFPTTFTHLAYRPLEDVLRTWLGGRHRGWDNARQDEVYTNRIANAIVLDPIADVFEWFKLATAVPLKELP